MDSRINLARELGAIRVNEWTNARSLLVDAFNLAGKDDPECCADALLKQMAHLAQRAGRSR